MQGNSPGTQNAHAPHRTNCDVITGCVQFSIQATPTVYIWGRGLEQQRWIAAIQTLRSEDRRPVDGREMTGSIDGAAVCPVALMQACRDHVQ